MSEVNVHNALSPYQSSRVKWTFATEPLLLLQAGLVFFFFGGTRNKGKLIWQGSDHLTSIHYLFPRVTESPPFTCVGARLLCFFVPEFPIRARA